jgi:hypothetical protein
LLSNYSCEELFMPRVCLLVLSMVLAVASPAVPAEDAVYEATLKAAGLKSDGQALLDFFRKRTVSEADQKKLAALIRQLGADEFEDRTRASEALTAAGRKAVPYLKAVVNDTDLEVARRAKRCLREIEGTPETSLVMAAAALIAVRKPAGSAEVLLAYLPFLEETLTEKPLFEAIASVAMPQGRLDPVLPAAVKGKHARQRAAAAWVLGRSSKAEDRVLVVPLLVDADAAVRFRAAEALVTSRDRRGLGTLVALLEKGPPELAAESENLLVMVAGEKAPPVPLGATDEQRRKCYQAWLAWWLDQGAKLDLAKLNLEQRLIGMRLVAVNNIGADNRGTAWEYGPDHKNRWQLRDAGGPFDVRVLTGGRVLLAEYNQKRVTERDRNGKIEWEFAPPNAPLEVQRLPNGNTLIATNYEIVEVTREKKVVFTFRDRSGNIFSAQKLSNGHVLYGLYTGAIVELDRAGKEVNRFAIERPSGLANIVVLPDGRYMVPLARSNRIVEMDRKGKVLREIEIASPTCVALLPEEKLLVGSHILSSVREIDRKGKVLWEQKAEGQVFRVRVR